MSDTVQVVRVDDSAVFVVKDGKVFYDSGLAAGSDLYFLGDVIELKAGNPVKRLGSDGNERLLHAWEPVEI